jgi:hypothetical protein
MGTSIDIRKLGNRDAYVLAQYYVLKYIQLRATSPTLDLYVLLSHKSHNFKQQADTQSSMQRDMVIGAGT